MPGLRAAARPAGTVLTASAGANGTHGQDDASEHGEPAEGSGLDEERELDPSLGETTVAELARVPASDASRSSSTAT